MIFLSFLFSLIYWNLLLKTELKFDKSKSLFREFKSFLFLLLNIELVDSLKILISVSFDSKFISLLLYIFTISLAVD